jgi:cytochrome c biogenesis protein CcmG/thiol:disulfide interchange protein DsbE
MLQPQLHQEPRMQKRKTLVVALSLVACGSSPAAKAPPSSQSSLLGQPAPSFKREAVDGTKVDVGTATGKVMVVKFIATYCQPCMKTLPAIEKLHEEHPEITVVGVSEDERESEAKDLASKLHLTFPVVHDQQQVLAARWRVRDLPVTYVLDGKGNVAWVGGPEKTHEDLVNATLATKP